VLLRLLQLLRLLHLWQKLLIVITNDAAGIAEIIIRTAVVLFSFRQHPVTVTPAQLTGDVLTGPFTPTPITGPQLGLGRRRRRQRLLCCQLLRHFYKCSVCLILIMPEAI
jgi:hypothetical protein